MRVRNVGFAVALEVPLCFMAPTRDVASQTAASAETQATPLQTLGTVAAAMSPDGYFAWAGPALCDRRENVYFIVAPPWPTGADGKTVGAAPAQRDVVRVSADGKKRTSFNPSANPKFANATELTTIAAALDKHGALFTLIWARWQGDRTHAEKSGQFIVSFNQDGKYKSHLELDAEQILVDQFEVFGSGDFLLRGRRSTPDPRLAILGATGQTLQDVRRWSGKFLEAPSQEIMPHFDHMVRGGDGRIYITQEDPGEDGEIVYAISPSGDAERLFKLPRMQKDPRLMGWRASGDRFAATYHQGGGRSGRWWVAVYGNAGDESEVQTTLYGPTPGPPICYEYIGSKDRFTFLKDGAKLVTMSSP